MLHKTRMDGQIQHTLELIASNTFEAISPRPEFPPDFGSV